MMNKILVICGPTATGKTSLGIKLAKRLNGEIISADSRQIYKGMNIITGKDLPEKSEVQSKKYKIGFYEIDKIPIWLLDAVAPNEKFNVADYYQLAWGAIEDIWQRGKLPVIVGGTGFYIKALLEGIGTMGIGSDLELREELSGKSADSLFEILEKINPERLKKMNESDRQNPRRLIRAIEISRGGKNQSSGRAQSKMTKVNALIVGLTALYEILYERIDKRVEERIKMGAEEEIKKLLNNGYNWDNSVLGVTIGYQQWREYFEKKITMEEMVKKWKFAEHNYCRRQMTWFRKIPKINWFDISKNKWSEEVEKLVGSWYI